jgi:thiol-disulfide isomerase/thioredoxin
MSQTGTGRPNASNRARRRAAEAAALRRRRWGFAAVGTAVLVVAGVIVGLHFTDRHATSTPTSPAAAPAAGHVAPPGTFTTLAGHVVNVASLRGQPTLVWFVSTWCSSCQAGTQAMAHDLAELHADGVRVEEVELYRDLGQSGPSLAAFAKALAGPQYGNPAWTFGVSSAALTRTYDPQSYLDIYYLLDADGRVAYVNSSPGSTMAQLLAAAGKLA